MQRLTKRVKCLEAKTIVSTTLTLIHCIEGDTGLERLRNFLRVIQPVNDNAEFKFGPVWPMLYCFICICFLNHSKSGFITGLISFIVFKSLISTELLFQGFYCNASKKEQAKHTSMAIRSINTTSGIWKLIILSSSAWNYFHIRCLFPAPLDIA